MFFASDNSGPVPPQILAALSAANEGYTMGYGDEPQMKDVRRQLRDVFEAPEAVVYLVATGTAANALALACLCQPWDTVFCTRLPIFTKTNVTPPNFIPVGPS